MRLLEILVTKSDICIETKIKFVFQYILMPLFYNNSVNFLYVIQY